MEKLLTHDYSTKTQSLQTIPQTIHQCQKVVEEIVSK